MNKTKIDWCDMTWNPVTGCLHNCPYCYAKKISMRFTGNFEPTFHENRLNEPQKVKTPQEVFVCSMADLFGDWVPDKWIEEVFTACEKAPWHKYLFLTKNPKRWVGLFKSIYFTDDVIDKMWFGQTLPTLKQPNYAWAVPNHFISIEPLLEEPKIDKGILFGTSWVIIGQQTNPTVVPKDEWVQAIIDECHKNNVPVFVKKPLYERFPIQEYPIGLRKETNNA